jgi:hypothetical protein
MKFYATKIKKYFYSTWVVDVVVETMLEPSLTLTPVLALASLPEIRNNNSY